MGKLIKVLVDRSRDRSCAGGIARFEPDDVYRTTDNGRALGRDVLKRYHVIVISGHSQLPYSDEEAEAVVRFVEEGGGLLLAMNLGRFLRDVGGDPEGSAVNRMGGRFGVRFFLPKEVGHDHTLVRGFPEDEVELVEHELWRGLGIGYVYLSRCCGVEGPEGAKVLLRHKGTGTPVALCFGFGRGRVVAVGDTKLLDEGGPACCPLLDWLSAGAEPEDGEVPDEVPPDEAICEREGTTVHYVPFVEDRVDKSLEVLRKVLEEFNRSFGKDLSLPEVVEVVPSTMTEVSYVRGDGSWGVSLGALPSEPKLAFCVGVMLYDMFFWKVRDAFILSGLLEGTLRIYLGTKAMRALGFDDEAEEMYGEFMKWLGEDPEGRSDFARMGWWWDERRIPQGVRIWRELEEKYGHLLPKLMEEFPEDPRKGVPPVPFTELDVMVWTMSRAVGEDLFPWFAGMGVTVHPLPPKDRDSPEFGAEVRRYLDGIFRDPRKETSERLEALEGMWEMDGRKPEELASMLESEDPYEVAYSALKLARASDRRAREALRRLLKEEDEGLRALSALALVRMGEREFASLLAGLAEGQDLRFKLDAGYALRRVGHEGGGRLQVSALKEARTDVVHRGFLQVRNEVDGYLVNEVWSRFEPFHFPGNIHVSSVYVGWVGTVRQYRRKGLARETMGRVVDHPAVRGCSCKRLHTGTRNVAHALYRSYGFVDLRIYTRYWKKLEGPEMVRPLEGVVVRGYAAGDEVAMAELANDVTSEYLGVGRSRATKPPRHLVIRLAEGEGKLLGWASARVERERARIEGVYVRDVDERLGVGQVLLCALHNELLSAGAKEVEWWPPEDEFLEELLQGMGYRSERTDGVEMFGVVDLQRLLEEISPLLEARLEGSKYRG
ncbi:MAG: hypothetical protein DRQ14_02695, partial [Candidatus Latescibacterota bacterium]